MSTKKVAKKRVDQDAILSEARAIAERVADDGDAPEELIRLGELLLRLDEHLRRGGALPNAWRREPEP